VDIVLFMLSRKSCLPGRAECLYRGCLLLALVGIVADARGGDDFDKSLKPLFAKNCTRCHGGKRPKGGVDLKEIKTAKQFLARPKLIKEIIEAIDASDMPPEDEPGLSEKVRVKLLASLKAMLRESTSGKAVRQVPLRRLNRFQYNNSVKDLFQLKSEVFRLPEKLMTRHGAYLNAKSGTMPERVEVECLSLRDGGGLTGVNAYPQDLRAAHGFDNQANQLTLSPLLLEAFLWLSVSIVESPDFHQGSVGVWNDFFEEPAVGADLEEEITKRLGPFLRKAFRGPVDKATLSRYTAYATTKIRQGLSFTSSMKKVASAALSSPIFLFRHESGARGKNQFELASKLSFFLWGSCPDSELLRLAERGELSKPEVLSKTLERMLADPKIERFVDAFPSQWMQLENVMAAAPDSEFFSLDEANPASLQMVLEPLLLFDAVFVENRPIVELIAPSFSYQSDFLKTWYTSDLKPPELDRTKIAAENRVRGERRRLFETIRQAIRADLAELDEVVLELATARTEHAERKAALQKTLKEAEATLERVPKPQGLKELQQDAHRRFEDKIRSQLGSRAFERVAASDPRYGGVITNAAMLSMTSGPKRTHPIARGAWIIEVIFNDPPPPPPNDVPPLKEEEASEKLTIRERFAKHRENPDCAGCHSRLDPLGFALENFDNTGRWRDEYENGREVDPSGRLLKKHEFKGIVQFKESLVKEERRFAKAFTGHLLRFALSRELSPKDSLAIDAIVNRTEEEGFKLRSLIREVVLSDSFLPATEPMAEPTR
jgi:hypothetical protein